MCILAGMEDDPMNAMSNQDFDAPLVVQDEATEQEASDMVTETQMMNSAMLARYEVPATVVAALRQAGKTAAFKLLALVQSDEFDELPAMVKVKIAETVMDRAFGKTESPVASLALMHRAGSLAPALGNRQVDGASYGELAKELEDRMEHAEMRGATSASEFKEAMKHPLPSPYKAPDEVLRVSERKPEVDGALRETVESSDDTVVRLRRR